MAIFSNSIIPAAAAAADDVVTKSLRFDRASSSKLTRTFGTPTSQKKVTISWWMKLAEQGNGSTGYCGLFVSGTHYTDYSGISLEGGTANKINSSSVTGGGYNEGWQLGRSFRDMGAWMHVCYVVDTTLSTAADRTKFYINGVRDSTNVSSAATNWPLNHDTDWSESGKELGIGLDNGTAGPYFGGYLAAIHYIDGQALTPSSFAEEDGDTGQWKPKAFVGVYGNNGFHLPFTDSTTSLTMVDSSSSAHVVTTNGADHDMAQNKIGNSSIHFGGDPNGSGNGDQLSIPGSSDFRFSGEFTIEGWVRGPSLSTAGDIFSIYGGAGGAGDAGFQIFVGNGSISAHFSNDGSAWTSSTPSYSFSNNTWYHLAVVRDSSDDILVFVDGVQQGSAVSFTGTIQTPSSHDTLAFGKRPDNINNVFTGYLDEIRISNTARYTSGFTPSTTAFVNDSNTKLLIHSDYLGGIGADTSVDTYLTATGGTITTDGDYKVHTFNSTGTFEATNASSAPIEYLVVAGGAGGGGNGGGGGGAGGYLTATGLSVAKQSYTVTVGAGGAKGAPSGATGHEGANGTDSTISTVTSTGGGGGSGTTGSGNSANNLGHDGGSGGGGGPFGSGGSGVSGQGYDGGSGTDNGGYRFGGGGGGGASGGGGHSTNGGQCGGCHGTGGAGGDGLSSSITGAAVTRGGGGSGCSGTSDNYPVTGGTGGGGVGGVYLSYSATAGSANTGGGGGGGVGPAAGDGDSAAGGSGCVILRYKFQ